MDIAEHVSSEVLDDVESCEAALADRNDQPVVEFVEHDLLAYRDGVSTEPDGRVVETTVGLFAHPDNWTFGAANPINRLMREHGYDGPGGSAHHGVKLDGDTVTVVNYYGL